MSRFFAGKKKFFSFLTLTAIILAIPLTVILSQRQQEIRQRASGNDVKLYFTKYGEDNTPLKDLNSAGSPANNNDYLFSLWLDNPQEQPITGFDITISGENLLIHNCPKDDRLKFYFFILADDIDNKKNSCHIAGVSHYESKQPLTDKKIRLIYAMNVVKDSQQKTGKLSVTEAKITSLTNTNYLSVEMPVLSLSPPVANAPPAAQKQGATTAAPPVSQQSTPAQQTTHEQQVVEGTGYSCTTYSYENETCSGSPLTSKASSICVGAAYDSGCKAVPSLSTTKKYSAKTICERDIACDEKRPSCSETYKQQGWTKYCPNVEECISPQNDCYSYVKNCGSYPLYFCPKNTTPACTNNTPSCASPAADVNFLEALIKNAETVNILQGNKKHIDAMFSNQQIPQADYNRLLQLYNKKLAEMARVTIQGRHVDAKGNVLDKNIGQEITINNTKTNETKKSSDLGAWDFSKISTGTYTVTAKIPSGYFVYSSFQNKNSAPDTKESSWKKNNTIEVTLSDNDDYADIYFKYIPIIAEETPKPPAATTDTSQKTAPAAVPIVPPPPPKSCIPSNPVPNSNNNNKSYRKCEDGNPDTPKLAQCLRPNYESPKQYVPLVCSVDKNCAFSSVVNCKENETCQDDIINGASCVPSLPIAAAAPPPSKTAASTPTTTQTKCESVSFCDENNNLFKPNPDDGCLAFYEPCRYGCADKKSCNPEPKDQPELLPPKPTVSFTAKPTSVEADSQQKIRLEAVANQDIGEGHAINFYLLPGLTRYPSNCKAPIKKGTACKNSLRHSEASTWEAFARIESEDGKKILAVSDPITITFTEPKPSLIDAIFLAPGRAVFNFFRPPGDLKSFPVPAPAKPPVDTTNKTDQVATPAPAQPELPSAPSGKCNTSGLTPEGYPSTCTDQNGDKSHVKCSDDKGYAQVACSVAQGTCAYTGYVACPSGTVCKNEGANAPAKCIPDTISGTITIKANQQTYRSVNIYVYRKSPEDNSELGGNLYLYDSNLTRTVFQLKLPTDKDQKITYSISGLTDKEYFVYVSVAYGEDNELITSARQIDCRSSPEGRWSMQCVVATGGKQTFTITLPAKPLQITLKADKATLEAGKRVNLTAKVNQNIEKDHRISIYTAGATKPSYPSCNGPIEKDVGCTTILTSTNAGTWKFVAQLETSDGKVLAKSNDVTITWAATPAPAAPPAAPAVPPAPAAAACVKYEDVSKLVLAYKKQDPKKPTIKYEDVSRLVLAYKKNPCKK